MGYNVFLDFRFLMDEEWMGVYHMWTIQHIGSLRGIKIGQP